MAAHWCSVHSFCLVKRTLFQHRVQQEIPYRNHRYHIDTSKWADYTGCVLSLACGLTPSSLAADPPILSSMSNKNELMRGTRYIQWGTAYEMHKSFHATMHVHHHGHIFFFLKTATRFSRTRFNISAHLFPLFYIPSLCFLSKHNIWQSKIKHSLSTRTVNPLVRLPDTFDDWFSVVYTV